MKIIDLLYRESIGIDRSPIFHMQAITMLRLLLEETNVLKKKEKVILNTEKMNMINAGGQWILFHTTAENLKKPVISVITVPKGMYLKKEDRQLVYLLFLLAEPMEQTEKCDKLAKRLSDMLKNTQFREKLTNVKTPDEFLKQMAREEGKWIYQKECQQSFQETLISIMAQTPEKETNKYWNPIVEGVWHVLPFLIGGSCISIFYFLLSVVIKLWDMSFLQSITGGALQLIPLVMAGYIAMNIGKKPAFAVGMVGGYMAVEGGSGMLGAVAAGYIAGYMILKLKKIVYKSWKEWEWLKDILIFPFFGLLGTGLLMIAVCNPLILKLETSFYNAFYFMGIKGYILLGAMILCFLVGGYCITHLVKRRSEQ